MKKPPYWTRPRTEVWDNGKGKKYKVVFKNGDFKPGTIKQIGSHIFGCSMLRASEVCTAGGQA
jgi:hypothetical protein